MLRYQTRPLRTGDSRFRVYLVQKATTIIFVENPRESPRLILEGLHILNLNYQNVARFGSLNLERTAQIVDFRQIDVLHIIRAIVVANLPTSPVDAFNLYNFTVLDRAAEWDCIRG